MNNNQETVTFVGAGNVASHLAMALAEAGYTIAGIYSRTMTSAQTLCERLSRVGQCPVATDTLDRLATADVYIISVVDDALPAVVDAWPTHCRQGVVLHTAGSVAMDVVRDTSDHYGVLYPMQTFSKDKTLDFSSVTCFIEGNDDVATRTATSLGSAIFGRCEVLSSEGRQQLHMAAVFACNFSNHMYALAYELLESHHIDPRCLLPLITETAGKVTTLHPHDGQTGPARRGDRDVVARHTAALNDNPELQQIYNILSESILRRFA